MAYIRTVKTASRATAVQIVHSNRRGSREIEHIGSAHTPEDVEVLKAVARQRLHAEPGHASTSVTAGLAVQDAADHVDPVPACCGRRWAWPTPVLGFDAACGQRRGVQGVGAGPADRADQQAGHDPGAGRDRRSRAPSYPHDQPAAARLRDR